MDPIVQKLQPKQGWGRRGRERLEERSREAFAFPTFSCQLTLHLARRRPSRITGNASCTLRFCLSPVKLPSFWLLFRGSE